MFGILYKYLICVLVLSEVWIFLQVFQRRKDFYEVLDIQNDENCYKTVIGMFPLHVCIIGQFKLEFDIRRIYRTMGKAIEANNSQGDLNQIGEKVVQWTLQADELHKKLHTIQNLYSEMFCRRRAQTREDILFIAW